MKASSRVIRVSVKVKKEGKGKHAKIVAAPKAKKDQVNKQRAYLAKRRALVKKAFKKNAKLVEGLKAKGCSFNEIMKYIVVKESL
jgi:hypothetical protein